MVRNLDTKKSHGKFRLVLENDDPANEVSFVYGKNEVNATNRITYTGNNIGLKAKTWSFKVDGN